MGEGGGSNPPLNAATVQPGPVIGGRYARVGILPVPLRLPAVGQVGAEAASETRCASYRILDRSFADGFCTVIVEMKLNAITIHQWKEGIVAQ